MSEIILEQIYRFPVKGFPGQQLNQTNIKSGEGIPNDRRFAITNGIEDTGSWMRARSFFINSVIDNMYSFNMHFDENTVKLKNRDGMALEFDLDNAASLAAANEQIIEFMQPVGIKIDAPPPKIIERKNHNANWDYDDTPISIINAESVRQIAGQLNAELDPARFRGNLIISGMPPWEEFALAGKRIKIGGIELEVHRSIDRCPTPGVNPVTGERDVPVTPKLNELHGHIYCGMYARVVKSGEIKTGDKLTVIGDSDTDWQDFTPENAAAYPKWPRFVEVIEYNVGNNATKMSLKAMGAWALPHAQSGQRIRLHFGEKGWTSEYIASASDEHYNLEVAPSETEDPMTELLRNGLTVGEKIVITGPFGRG